MVSVGTCILGKRPCVALALADSVSRTEVEPHVGRGVDLVEVRIDQFTDVSPDHVTHILRQYEGIPRIGTIRSSREGGGWQHDEATRLALYRAIMSGVEAVDIEIGADDINREVMRCAKEHDVTTIGSFHDFDGTPHDSTLASILEKGKSLGVDIVKVAAHCAGQEDLRRLARFLVGYEDCRLIVIGMGASAIASRILFPALGSLITYTFLGRPTAPGQLNCEETIACLKKLYPQQEDS